MPRRKRELAPGYYCHLYDRSNHHQAIFFERANYLYFLKQFRYYLMGQTMHAIAYCWMPNHYHFLIYLRDDSLSAAMQKFSLSYANAINRRYSRCGSLFQGRFQTIRVDSNEYLLSLTRYLHLNPVKAQLVLHPEEWESSRHREYVNLHQETLPKLDMVRPWAGTAQTYQTSVEALAENPQQPIQQFMLG
ncbi:MAG: transposase [Leptolyngbya sp. SIO1E4]|nr:transposase [Leptolyngbya sp. SIO1E4]